ncbi:MAG: pyridoxal-phosphate dependent enzyme, partial [Pseudomonadota bacterium]
VATEPEAAQLLAGKEWQPHKIQGWTPDFVPGVLNREIFDALIPVTDDESIATAQALAHKEGIFTGISGGGTFAAALRAAKDAPEGSVLLAMLPDTAERYLSTPLFADVAEGSDDDWLTTLSQ